MSPKTASIEVTLADLPEVRAARAMAYLRWCAENYVVPGDRFTAGCGCCNAPIETPSEFADVVAALTEEAEEGSG